VKRLFRWVPVSAAALAATLVTVNSFRSDRPQRDPMTTEVDPPSAETTAVGRRTDWRVEVVADLVAGRITAAEAHARFLDANRSDPTALENLRYAYPGETDEERTVHQLVRFVRASKHRRATAVAASLVPELLAHDWRTAGTAADRAGP
jgi:hypothetical protein